MRHFLPLFVYVFAAFSCTKDNKLDTYTEDDAVIWPLNKGNSWTYSGFIGYADNGSKDTTDLLLVLDSTRLMAGNELYALNGNYDHWYRLGRAQVYMINGDGSQSQLIASHVSQETVLHQESGTYNYFEGGGSFNGSLTRIAYPEITVINKHNSARTEDIYKDEAGSVIQKKVVFYAIDKGPTCYKYYGNRETPGSGNIYLMLQYTIDTMVIIK